MNKEEVLYRVKELRLLAVIRGPSPELTVQMVDALLAGGVSGIEITYSTPHAEEVVKTLLNKYGQSILLGMGTLTRTEQVASAKAAGANFLVSPICEATLVETIVASGLLTMVGTFTPTEVFQAFSLGADIIKIFPGSVGGPAYIKSLKGPFPDIPMMPTGGVKAENLSEWFAAGVIAVGAGSELCPPALAKEGKFEQITKIATEYFQTIQSIKKSIEIKKG